MLETAKYTCAILVEAVAHTHPPQTREITRTTVPIEAQETTGFTETTNETGEIREIKEANTTTTTEATGPGRKTSP